MKRFNLTKIVSLMLACIMLVGMMAIPTFAEDTSAEAPVITSTNVEIGETIKMMFAVHFPDGATNPTVQILDENNTNLAQPYYDEDGKRVTFNGDNVWVVKVGVPAQHIAKEVKVTASYSGSITVSEKYSVLEYLYTRLNVSTDVTTEQRAMYNALLEYAKAAEAVLNPNAKVKIADYGFVNAVDCSSVYYVNEEGKEVYCDATGIYPNGTVLKFTTDLVAQEGHAVVFDVNGTTVTVEDMEANGVKVDGVMTVTATTVETGAGGQVEATLATFTMGENGAASHNDGNEKTAYTETVNSLTLSITNGTKMYTGARDAKGNSCIKFGTSKSSVIGSMQFTVPDNVTKVIIYVAKYKANTTKVTINGQTYTLTNSSDNGEYDAIEVDTSTNKTVTFTTVSSSQRAMLNGIDFIGYAQQ